MTMRLIASVLLALVATLVTVVAHGSQHHHHHRNHHQHDGGHGHTHSKTPLAETKANTITPETKVDCSRRDILPLVPAEQFEPSDAAWDASSRTLYVVDDNGRLAAIPGSLVTQLEDKTLDNTADLLASTEQTPFLIAADDIPVWQVVVDLDLEGCAVDHEMPELVYLGAESPAEIIVFNVTERQIVSRFPIGKYFEQNSILEDVESNIESNKDDAHTDKKKKKKKRKNPDANSGLEALAFLKTSADGKPMLLAGRQSDTRLFVFELNESRSSVTFVGSVIPPGPGRDLAAISVFAGRVFFVFDKEYEANSVAIGDLMKAVSAGKWGGWPLDKYRFEERGQEGLAFAYPDFACSYGEDSAVCGDLGDTAVIYAIDPPRRDDYTKQIQIGEYRRMRECWLQK